MRNSTCPTPAYLKCPTLGRLTTLRALDISGATFTTVPPQIGALTELTLVTAQRLPGAVPAGLHHLPALADLDLRRLGRPYFGDSRTPLPLPEPLMRMPTLRRLRLSGARIASMADGRNAIETLEISGGLLQVDRLPDLSGMATLRTLDLSANDLTGLPDDIFVGTPRLRRIVRLQLKTGRTADAHATVARILARRPGFAALADLAEEDGAGHRSPYPP